MRRDGGRGQREGKKGERKQEGREGGEGEGGRGREDAPYTVSSHHLQVTWHTAPCLGMAVDIHTFDSVAVKQVHFMFDLLGSVFHTYN